MRSCYEIGISPGSINLQQHCKFSRKIYYVVLILCLGICMLMTTRHLVSSMISESHCIHFLPENLSYCGCSAKFGLVVTVSPDMSGLKSSRTGEKLSVFQWMLQEHSVKLLSYSELLTDGCQEKLGLLLSHSCYCDSGPHPDHTGTSSKTQHSLMLTRKSHMDGR